jgi:hypothetical protein
LIDANEIAETNWKRTLLLTISATSGTQRFQRASSDRVAIILSGQYQRPSWAASA